MTHGAVYRGHLLSELRKSQSWPGRGGKGNGETKEGRDGRREGDTEGRKDRQSKRKKGTNFPCQEIKNMNHQGEILTSHILDQCKKEI